jgi:predicted HTH domain antitoxin
MAITIQIPNEIEQDLRRKTPNLDESAREQFLIANYQAGKLSTGDIAVILGLETRLQAEQWLGERGISRNYSPEALDADRKTLDRLLGPVKP